MRGLGNISGSFTIFNNGQTISSHVSTADAFSDDGTPPAVETITVKGSPRPSDETVTFTVTFDRYVESISVDDFNLIQTGSAVGSITSVSSSEGGEVDVTVGSVAGTGSIRLDLKSNTDIRDVNGNGNGTNGFVAAFQGSTHTVEPDTAAPTLTAVTMASNGSNSGLAGIGDVITLTMTADEVINTLPLVTLAGETASVSGQGTTSLTATLTVASETTNGQTAVSISAYQDSSGNIGQTVTSLTSGSPVIIDTQAPDKPAPPDLANAADAGPSDSDNITNNRRPTFVGSTEANASVSLLRDGVEIASGSADNSGNYSLSPSEDLDVGTASFTTTATDALGNVSEASDGLSVTIDQSEFTHVSTARLTPTDGSVSVGENGSVVFRMIFSEPISFPTSAVTIGGGAGRGFSVESVTDVPANDRAFDITLKVADVSEADGSLGLGLTRTSDFTDLAGNAWDNDYGSVDEAYSVSADTQVPAGYSVSFDQNLVTQANRGAVSFTFSGAEPDATYHYTITSSGGGDPVIGTGEISGSDDQIANIDVSALNVGTLTLSVTLTDRAANVGSAVMASVLRADDTTPPAKPAAPDLTAASDTGLLDDDNITQLARPTFTGTVEADATVSLRAGGTEVASGSADESGNYSLSPSSNLSEGQNDITVTATDAAGNTSETSEALQVTIDAENFTHSSTVRQDPTDSNVTLGANGSVTMRMIFSEAVTLPAAAVSVGGGASGGFEVGAVTSVDGDDTAFDITLSVTDPGNAAGSLGLGLKSGITGFTDVAGNFWNGRYGGTDEAYSITIDSVAPSIDSTTAPASNVYGLNDILEFTLTYDDMVIVTGTPQIPLKIGTTARSAGYVSGSNSNTLTFRYTIVAGDEDFDGIAAGSGGIALNGGTIKDENGNDAALTPLSFGDTSGIIIGVDAVSPTVQSVAVPSDDVYGVGDTLDFVVTFDEAVTVTGVPRLPLTVGSSSREAEYLSGTGSSALTFRYTIQSGDQDLDGVSVGSNLSLNSGALKDASGNDAVLTLNSVGSTANVQVATRLLVDLSAASVTQSISGLCTQVNPTGFGLNNVTITGVTRDGSPGDYYFLYLLDPNNKVLNSDLNVVFPTFVQTPTLGLVNAIDPTGNGNFSFVISDETDPTNDFDNGDTYTGSFENQFSFDASALDSNCPGPDSTAPSISESSKPDDGRFVETDTLDFTVTYDEAVTVTGTPQIPLIIGSTARNAVYVSGSDSEMLTFRYTVSADDLDTDGIAIGEGGISLNGATIQDAAGNDAALTPLNFSDLSAVLVGADTIAPQISSVSIPADNIYMSGEALDFGVTFDEAVIVTGTPQLPVTVGSTLRQADYLSGSGTTELTFRYTVQASDRDVNGVTLGTALGLNGGILKDAADNDAVLTLSSIPDTSGVRVATGTFIDLRGANVSLGTDGTCARSAIGSTNTVFRISGIEINGVVDDSSGRDFYSIGVFDGLGNLIGGGTGFVRPGENLSSIDARVNQDPTGEGQFKIIVVDFDQFRFPDPSIFVETTDNSVTFDASQFDADCPGLDMTGPVVSSVDVPAGAAYAEGQAFDFTVNFSESVEVNTAGGAPTLTLTIGATKRAATLQSGAGTNALLFRYTVQAGDADMDGITIGTLRANGAVLDDRFNNVANLGLNNVGSTSAVLVDTTPPTISSVVVPADGTYSAGSDLDFVLTFSEVVTATETPQLALTIGSEVRQASLQSGSGATTLTFRYTVQEGDSDPDGITVGILSLNGGTLQDAAGNPAKLTLTNIGSTSGVLVTSDTEAPSNYAVSWDQAALNQTTAQTASFTFAGAEPSASYAYTITSNGGAGELTNTGTINTAKDQITGIDLSVLPDGELTLSVTLTDPAGNEGAAVEATVTKMTDNDAPVRYMAAWDQTVINSTNVSAASFTFSGAELGADYQYTITSNGGPGTVSDSGTIAAAGDQITNIDLSSLPDGELTLSVTLTDPAGNIGAASETSLDKDVQVPAIASVSRSDPTEEETNADSLTFEVFFSKGPLSEVDIADFVPVSSSGTPTTAQVTEVQQVTYGYAVTLSGGDLLTYAGNIGIGLAAEQNIVDSSDNPLSDTLPTGDNYQTYTHVRDFSSPSGYTVSFDEDLWIFATAKTASFSFENAEIGATYNYTIKTNTGTEEITGSGTIATQTDQIKNIDLTSLTNGTLILDATLTDASGNEGRLTRDLTSSLNASTPGGGRINISDPQLFTDGTCSAADPKTQLGVFYDGTGGGADAIVDNKPVDWTAFILTDAEGTILAQTSFAQRASASIGGSFILSIGQTPKGFGNSNFYAHDTATETSGFSIGQTYTPGPKTIGSLAFDASALDADCPGPDDEAPKDYTVSFDQTILNPTTAKTASFTFTDAEVGAIYNYTISSESGAGSVSDTGTIVTATDTITEIDLSGLPDGELTLSVTLTDAASNEGVAAEATVVKDSVAPRVTKIERGFTSTGQIPEITDLDALSWRVEFSEDVAVPVANDFSVSGTDATVSVSTINNQTFLVEISGGNLADLDGIVELSFASEPSIQDKAGNALRDVSPTGANDNSFTVQNDTTAPTLLITGGNDGLTRGPFTATFTFDEIVTGFNAAAIDVFNGTVSEFQDSNAPVYTALITPSSEGDVRVNILNSVVSDLAGNVFSAGKSLDVTNDTTRPSVEVRRAVSGVISGETDVTFTFSEAVKGFTLDDIVVTDGVASGLNTLNGILYTVTITPNENFNGDLTVTVHADIATDEAGNANIAAATPLSITADQKGPTVTVETDTVGPVGKPFDITITFSETVGDFTQNDIDVANAEVSDLNDKEAPVYTATLSPVSNSAISVFIPKGVATDAAGNPNSQSNSLNIAADIAAPSVTFAGSDQNSPFAGAFTGRVDFSEPVEGFGLDDLILSQGEASDLVVSSDRQYRFTVTPVETGNLTISVKANAVTDRADNANAAFTGGPIAIDLDAPTIPSTPDLAQNSDSGQANTDNLTNISRPVFEGTAEPRVTVQLRANGAIVASGKASNLGTWQLTPLESLADGAYSVTATTVDALGNVSEPSDALSVIIDTASPSLAFIRRPESTPELTTASQHEFVVGFTEAVYNLTSVDAAFAVSFGVIRSTGTGPNIATAVAQNATTYTLTTREDQSYEGPISLTLLANPAIGDLAGNQALIEVPKINEAYQRENIFRLEAVRREIPVEAVSNVSSLPFDLIFSAIPEGLDTDDVRVTGALDGQVTTARPTSIRIEGTVAKVTIADGDLATFNGTVGLALTQDATITRKDSGTSISQLDSPNPNQTYQVTNDVVAPTVAISSSVSGSVSAAFPITVTFSEDIFGFEKSDLSIANGTVTNFDTTSATTFTATVTPKTNGEVTIDIGANAGRDVAGNESIAASTFSVTFDSVAPTVNVPEPPTAVNGPFDLAFNFSEEMTGLDVSDFQVTNGTAILSGGPKDFTVTITPDGTGDLSVSLPADSAFDPAGNGNEAFNADFEIDFDVTPPTVNVPEPPTAVNGPFDLAFNFSEEMTGLDVSDFQVTNGTAILSGGPKDFTVTITPDGTGDLSVGLPADSAFDPAGNGNEAFNADFEIDFDKVSPTPLLSSSSSATVSGTFLISIIFDEDVSAFEAEDIVLVNAALSDFTAISLSTYSASVTPKVDGTVSVSIPANVATDSAGNSNEAAPALTRTSDGTAPGVSIDSTASGLVAGVFPITISFTEDVTGFTSDDISIENGTLSDFAGDGETYTASVTPLGDGTITVDVSAGIATDAAGNKNSAAVPFTLTSDETAPEVVLTSSSASTVAGAFTIIIAFSEVVTDFVQTDLTVENGLVSDFQAESGSEYSATITPTADGAVSVSIAANVATDAAGNGNTMAAPLTRSNDETAPTVSVASTASGTVSGSFPISVTFSEDVTGFTSGDIELDNGTLSDFSGTGAVYTATITPTTDGFVRVSVAAAAAQDTAANDNTVSNVFSIETDGTAPTVELSSDAPITVAGAFIVTITFSENVNSFSLADLTVENGTASDFSADTSSLYTVLVTPDADGPVSVSVAANVAQDVAGNSNTVSNSLTRNSDVTAPSVILASTSSDVISGVFEIMLTFSEAVSGFTVDDVTVNNGTLSDFSGSGAVYTALITPTADGTVSVSIAANVATDAAGNGNMMAAPLTRSNDETAPTVTLASTASGTVSGSFPITFTFSEDVTGFTIDDVTVSNGTLSGFSGSGTIYNATITPQSDGIISVTVSANAAKDAAQNGSTASDPLTLENDSTAPNVLITSTASDLVSGAFPITVTFSEAVTDFEVSDLTVTNGTVSNFAATSASVYKAIVTPTVDGTVAISVAANAAQDSAGNGNEVAPTLSIETDGTAPTVLITSTASDLVSGTFPITVTFSEAVTSFELSDLTVTNGTISNFAANSASEYSAIVTPSGDGTVSVSVLAAVAQDVAANDNLASNVFSIKTDGTAPTLLLASQSPEIVSGAFAITISFSEAVTGFLAMDLTVENGLVSDFQAASGSEYSATITPTADGTVSVSIAANVATDAAGNGNTMAAPLTRSNDETAPTVSVASTASGTVSGSFPITVTFSEDVTGFTSGDIELDNGTLSDFSGTGAIYTATVTPASDGIISISVSAAAAQDAATNGNSASDPFIVETDGTAPSVVLTTSSTGIVSGSFPITMTFSEDVTGFEASDVIVTNGTVSDFAVTSAAIYTATVTPMADGAVDLIIEANAAQDGAGNGNEASQTLSVETDGTAPTVVLTTSSTGIVSGSFPITVTFSEAITGFVADDLVAENGMVTEFLSVSETVFTAIITPTADGISTLTVAEGVAQDSAGNGNMAAEPLSVTIDGTAPSVRLASTASGTVSGSFPITVTFSEEVTGFAATDISVDNGTLSDFAVTSASVFTALVTPNADGPVLINVAAAVATDVAGNGNNASEPLTVETDGTAPSVVIARSETGPVSGLFSINVSFSEAVSGFTLDDLTVENGTASAFTVTSDAEYSATVTPTTDGTVTVSVAAGVAQDVAGNANIAAVPIEIESDGTPPTVTLTSDARDTVAGPFEVTIVFSEAVSGFELDDLELSNVVASDLEANNAPIFTIQLTPSGDGDISVIVKADAARDSAGNGNIISDALTRESDATAPTLAMTTPDTEVTGPFVITLTFSEDVTGFEETAIVLENGTLSDFSGNGAVYTATVTPVTVGDVSVTVDDGSAEDVAGNQAKGDSLTVAATGGDVDVTLEVNTAVSDPGDVNASFDLSNPGSTPIVFTASADQPWVDVDPTSGTIGALEDLEFNISLNDGIDDLPPGTYVATVTVTVEDGATASAKSSPVSAENGSNSSVGTVLAVVPITVEVEQRFGNFELVVRTPSGPAGGALISYSSDIAAIDSLSVPATIGVSRTSITDLLRGTYRIEQALPDGFSLVSASCAGDTDNGTVIDLEAGRIDLDLDPDERISCVFENDRDEDAIRIATQRAIRNFMARRGDRLIEAAPDLSKRFSDRRNAEGGSFSAEATDRRANMDFRTSLAGFRNRAANEAVGDNIDFTRAPSDRWDAWLGAEYSRIDDKRDGQGVEGEFFVAQLGLDYALSSNLILGGLLQYDSMSEEDAELSEGVGAIAGAKVSGDGYMVGPYLVWEPRDGLIIDAMGLWGPSDNQIDPLGYYEDKFETDRLMLRGSVTGQLQSGPWRINPQLTWTHFEDEQKSYTDSLGIDIPSQTVSIGRLRAGPEVIWTHRSKAGVDIELGGSLRGVWNYDGAGRIDASGLISSGGDPVRADGELLFGLRFPRGISLNGRVGLDGIGDGDFSARSGRLEFFFTFGGAGGLGSGGVRSLPTNGFDLLAQDCDANLRGGISGVEQSDCQMMHGMPLQEIARNISQQLENETSLWAK